MYPCNISCHVACEVLHTFIPKQKKQMSTKFGADLLPLSIENTLARKICCDSFISNMSTYLHKPAHEPFFQHCPEQHPSLVWLSGQPPGAGTRSPPHWMVGYKTKIENMTLVSIHCIYAVTRIQVCITKREETNLRCGWRWRSRCRLGGGWSIRWLSGGRGSCRGIISRCRCRLCYQKRLQSNIWVKNYVWKKWIWKTEGNFLPHWLVLR